MKIWSWIKKSGWVKMFLLFCIFLAINIILSWIFPAYLKNLFESLSDGEWWATGILNWIIFGLSVAGFIKISNWLEEFPFRNYKVVTKNAMEDDDSKGKSYDLAPQDAKAMVGRSYEGWQLLKSIISPSYWITTAYFDDAIDGGWLRFDKENKRIFVIWVELEKSNQFDPTRSKALETIAKPK